MPESTVLTLIRPGALGDSLLLAPALQLFGNSRQDPVRLVGYPSRLEPLRKAGLAESVQHLDDWLAERRTEPEAVDGRVVSFISLPFTVTAGDRPIEEHAPFPPDSSREHVAVYLARCLGLSLKRLDISPLKSLVRFPRKTGTQGITLWIHPGAGNREKRWPLDGFLQLREEIDQLGEIPVRFLLGEGDSDLMEFFSDARIPFLHEEDITRVIEHWRKNDWFLGNDSGVTHLAGLCGLNTVALFGPTDPDLWRPCGERVHLMRGGDGQSFPPPEAVIDFLRKRMTSGER